MPCFSSYLSIGFVTDIGDSCLTIIIMVIVKRGLSPAIHAIILVLIFHKQHMK